MSVQVRPATPERWDDLTAVFGRRGDDPMWCWCQRLILPEEHERAGAADNRGALHEQVMEGSIPPGLIAYIDDEPVGWTRVGPRALFVRPDGNGGVTKLVEQDGDAWWVSCFAVSTKQRSSGVGTSLLRAAVDFARDHGASVVEGHPTDVAGLQASKVGGSALFTGTMRMFLAASFSEIGRTSANRPIMHRVV
jgi:GNAT superfamily N-acetyltransferase